MRYRSVGYLALEGGPPGFPRGSSCPVVLKLTAEDLTFLLTGLSPSSAACPKALQLRPDLVTSRRSRGSASRRFLPPPGLSPRATKPGGFGLFPVRSPLLGESRLISSPRGTEMVQFPRFPPDGVGSPSGARSCCLRAGCPIRKSPDLRLPAAPRGISPLSHVLHRPDTPRHSPCAMRRFTACTHDRSSVGKVHSRGVPPLESRHAREERSRPRPIIEDRGLLQRPKRRTELNGSLIAMPMSEPIAGSVWPTDFSSLCQTALPNETGPAARSRTATMLRHHPDGPPPPSTAPSRPGLTGAVRPPLSDGEDTPDVTGKLCGVRERIHRRVLTGSY
jgi:hypothetical protein